MSKYEEVDNLKFYLEQRWNARGSHDFPYNKGDFVESFKHIEDYMNENCHKDVTLGAAINGSGLLTDHGVDHVQMVIRNAYHILTESGINRLTGYELYILLLAIHFHDLGNIYGREEHEKKISDVMEILGNRIPLDTPERIMVSDIATSHGGVVSGSTADKDTLCKLPVDDACNGIKVRPALLASIIRFADELSDDNTRAKRFIDETSGVPALNQIYHEYSKSLSPILVNGNVVVFKYYIPFAKLQSKIPDESGKYLYDEILCRLRKCMCELEYCRKYSQGYINITTLSVEINMLAEGSFRVFNSFKFSLRLSGYPSTENIKFESLPYQTGSDLKDALTVEERGA